MAAAAQGDDGDTVVDPAVRAGRYKVVAPMSRDRRPCRGDLFVKAGPRLRRLDCENCAAYKDRGGKCLGHRGWKAAREAGVKLEVDTCRET